MKLVLIGHRGTGKSHLLDRLRTYWKNQFPQQKYFDLDREIEFRQGKTISQIFNESGEASFRAMEAKVFRDLLRDHSSFVISLGAGFPLQEIPPHVKCLWVRRKTDAFGRIFLNRPRLNPDISPLDEYLQKMPFREERYKAHATDEYLMPEGLEGPNVFEERIFKNDFKNLGGILTLLPSHLRNLESLQDKIRNFEVDYFELRDDLLSLQQIQTVTSLLPAQRILLSLRAEKTHPWLQEFLRTGIQWDWALELGSCPFGPAPVFSIHQIPNEALGTLSELDAYLETKKIPASSHVKLSPMVGSFHQLKMLLQWQHMKPESRSVLPRSSSGRWNWFRLWLKGKQKINFFRLDQGSAPDQPTLYEWLSTPAKPSAFAALLGHPVFHSRTPLEQQTFFNQWGLPIFAVDIEEDEFETGVNWLQDLGFQAGAVTSPLKNQAFQWAQMHSPTALEMESANTLHKKDGVWRAHNTDLDGFKALLSQIEGDLGPVAVWGGGGTLPVILKICPQAICYSVRTGEIKRQYGDQSSWSHEQIVTMQSEGPRVLIWAASPEADFPPKEWKPEFVLDLNYREDSLARDYAIQVGAQYIDGLIMFKEQAAAQRVFWGS